MKWALPQFAHIPLIHTIEGKKLSKRDNASTLDDYSKIGIMPNALRNYLSLLSFLPFHLSALGLAGLHAEDH